MTRSLLLVAAVLVALVTGSGLARAAMATPDADLSALSTHVDSALASLKQGRIDEANRELAAFNAGWPNAEDGVRALSRASYRAIEDAQGEATFALKREPFDAVAAARGLERLKAECDAFALSFRGLDAPAERPTSRSSNAPTLASVVQHLTTASARLQSNDPTGARTEVDAFAREWTDVEGEVKVRSGRVYTDTENNTARARALLGQRPPDTAGAQQVLGTMRADLAPIVEAGGRYTAFDAAAILLREGLEALLVVGALLAFLNKSGNGDKARWIWLGSGLAIIASIGVALAVNAIFAQASAGANRELLEGLTGLVAAVLLLYVSYWLHSKASLGAWQRYIQVRGTEALAGNSMFSLALLAFLAVFREGAETVLFYVGIGPAISPSELLLGLGIGSAGLVVCGVLVLGLGVRLPLRVFFLGTSVLIYYLAFKFVGAGIHALQVSGYAPATPLPFLPSSDLVGLFPTLETTAVQALLVLGTATVLLLSHRQAAPQAAH